MTFDLNLLAMRNAALHLAADLLTQVGWAPRSKGWPRYRGGPLRITQALAEVLGHDMGETPASIPAAVSDDALTALLKQLGNPGSVHALWDWEEQPGRTQDEAIALLHATAK
jgi:hypothetical protein